MDHDTKRYASEQYVEEKTRGFIKSESIDSTLTVSGNVADSKAVGDKIAETEGNLKGYVDTSVASMVDSAPETLNTLNELAAALGDDANFAATVAETLGEKYSADNPPPYPVTSVNGQSGAVTFATEEWTFTLSNGSTVTKKVLIG